MSYNLVDPTTGDLTRVAGNSNIVDTAIETTSTWSSKKINDSLVNITDKLEKNVKFDVDDLNTAYVPNKTITVRTNKNTKNLPSSSIVNFLVTSFAYIEGQYYRITQYCYENSENLSSTMYVRRGVSNNGESSITWSSWKGLCATTVKDVPKTYINTFEDETYVKPTYTNVCSYSVTNGICVIKLETACLSTTDDFVQILSGLPKPKEIMYSNAIDRAMNSNSGAKGLFQLVTDGTLRVVCNYGDSSVSGVRYFYVTFSYLVAES